MTRLLPLRRRLFLLVSAAILPVAAVSGFALYTVAQQQREHGFDLHLVKPVDHEKLEEALRA